MNVLKAFIQPRGLALVAVAMLIAPSAATAQQEPLPRRTDIPADYSTVICPNEAQARRMLNEFYVAGDTWFNGQAFMRGLTATGCQQLSGPLEIRDVLARKRVISTETGIYLLYRATRPSGESVFGVVHEAGNNRHGRTPQEKWLQNYSADGVVTANTDGRTTYVCPTPDAAMAVIAAIPLLRDSERGTKVSRQTRARDAALKANKCTRGDGKYTVSNVHNHAFISLGYESGEEWTALTALDRRGLTVGLLYDSSQH
jgi:hypothetical protein